MTVRMVEIGEEVVVDTESGTAGEVTLRVAMPCCSHQVAEVARLAGELALCCRSCGRMYEVRHLAVRSIRPRVAMRMTGVVGLSWAR